VSVIFTYNLLLSHSKLFMVYLQHTFKRKITYITLFVKI